ncbi:MAG: Methionine aminopeptidase [Herbinix sp.]|jgi:methionyl aminopeptidase|nr:Methionine aminopeptidase [Herbinix sp.]
MNKKYDRNDLCWCGSGRKYKICHSSYDERVLTYKSKGCIVPDREIIKSKKQIDGIRDSGKINIAILDYVRDHIHIGMSTEEINNLVYDKTKELGGVPAPLGFEGYPKSVCTSINNEVCHGIPSEKVILKDGDIINVDVSTIVNGYFSDSSRMFCLGNVSDEKRQLVEVAKKSIEVGLSQIKAWNFLGDMGQEINDYVQANGYSVVKDIGGHGVGIEFHEEPFVSYVSKRGTEMLMVPGMVFTIEPMINMGKPDVFISKINGWTAYTKDGKDSAQWEVTVLVTESGYEILAY